MQINDPATRTALENLGCLVNNELNTAALTALLVAELEQHHVAADLDDVDANEITAGQLVFDVVGHSDEQLLDLVKPLLSTEAKGRVQRSLTNGYVLCAGRVRVAVIVGGETKNVSVATRFLSADADVVVRHLFDSRQKRAESAVNHVGELAALVEARNPAMAAEVSAFLSELVATWQTALGTGTVNP
jgi:hypothetical protein